MRTFAPHKTGVIGLVGLVVFSATTACKVYTVEQLPAIQDPRLVGEWKLVNALGQVTNDLTLIRFIDGDYRVGKPEDFIKGDVQHFTLTRFGNTLLSQTRSSAETCSVWNEDVCYEIYGVEFVRDEVRFYEFDSERVAKDSISGAITLPNDLHRSRLADGSVTNLLLLRGSSSDLSRFLASYVKDSMVFDRTNANMHLRFQKLR